MPIDVFDLAEQTTKKRVLAEPVPAHQVRDVFDDAADENRVAAERATPFETFRPGGLLSERAAKMGRPMLELDRPPIDATKFEVDPFTNRYVTGPPPLTEEEKARAGSISARKPGLLERGTAMFREAVPATATKTVYHPTYGRSQLLEPEAALTPMEQARHPIATGVAEFGGGLTSPENTAILAATGGLGTLPGAAGRLIPRLVSGGFSLQMIKGVYDQAPEFKRAMDEGNESEALRIITHMTLGGAMAGLAGGHAAGAKTPMLPAYLERKAAAPAMVRPTPPTEAVAPPEGGLLNRPAVPPEVVPPRETAPAPRPVAPKPEAVAPPAKPDVFDQAAAPAPRTVSEITAQMAELEKKLNRTKAAPIQATLRGQMDALATEKKAAIQRAVEINTERDRIESERYRQAESARIAAAEASPEAAARRQRTEEVAAQNARQEEVFAAERAKPYGKPAEAAKPAAQTYAPDVLEDAQGLVGETLGKLGSLEKPGVYWSETAITERGEAAGREGSKPFIYGIKSHFGDFPWLKETKVTLKQATAAMEKGKGADYERLMHAAAKEITRQREAAKPIITEYAPELQRLAQETKDVDPNLSSLLTDLAEGRTSVDSKRLREYIKERIDEAESAAQFSRAVDDAAHAARTAEGVGDVDRARGEGHPPLEAPPIQQTSAIVRVADQPTIPVDLTPEGLFTRRIEEIKRSGPQTPAGQVAFIRENIRNLTEQMKEIREQMAEEQRAGNEGIVEELAQERADTKYALGLEEALLEETLTRSQGKAEATLPGMERAVREQKEAAAALQGEQLTAELRAPLTKPQGEIEKSPLFRGTEAVPQKEMFAPSGKLAAAKEPWQMTRAEYEAAYGKPKKNTTVTGGFSPHKESVAVAVNQGKPVPPEVLAEYPELAEPKGPSGGAYGEGTLYANPLTAFGKAYSDLVGTKLWEGGKRLAVATLRKALPDYAFDFLGRQFVTRYGQPAEYVEASKTRKKLIGAGFERAQELGERLQKGLSREEQQALGRMVKGEANAGDLQTMRTDARWNDAIEAAKQARADMDSIGFQAVMQGLLRDESFFRNYGKYMPRLYRKYELQYGDVASKYGEKMPTRLDLDRFRARKDIPEEIRMLMGEILEPAYPVAKGLAQMAHDVETAKLFRFVADRPEWAATDLNTLWTARKNPQDYVQMPESKKLGPLSGKWVEKHIADDINLITRAHSEAAKVGRALISEWKFNKVILNPATHGRNLMSNVLLNHLGGLPMTRVDVYYRGLRDLATKGEYYREAKEQTDLMQGTFAQVELDALLDSWNKTRGGLMDRVAKASQLLREGRASQALNQVRLSQTKFGEKAAGIYQGEEAWFKLSKYIHNREAGMEPKAAAADAQAWLFDYSEVPKFVDWARRSPFGAPFITFTYKALPRVAESAVKAPWRIGGIMAGIYAIQQASSNALGIDEKQSAYLESIKPPRMKGKFAGTPKYLLMPWKDKYGQLQFLDLTYILPWGDIGETGASGIPNALPGYASPMRAFAELALNKSGYTGKEIYKFTDSPAEVTRKTSLFLWRFAAPPLAPGGYGFSRLQKAVTGEVDYFGRTSSLPTAAASSLLGLKTTPFDPVIEARMRRSERNQAEREIAIEEFRVRRNRALTGEEKRNKLQKLAEQRRKLLKSQTPIPNYRLDAGSGLLKEAPPR